MNCLKCLLPINLPKPAYYGLHPECFVEWFKVPQLTHFSSLQQKESPSESTLYSSQDTSFFSGKFKKYSAELDEQSYILKMRQSKTPELPEVEYLCNQIGKLLKIPVAEFYLIDFNGERTFVTKNFINPKIPTDLQHICHFRASDQHNCSGLIKVIQEKSQNLCDIKILIKTILFDSLIGNHDRHGRNLAFIVKSNHTCLSPIYDNVSYLSLESGNMLKADFNPTGKISTSTADEPTMRDYVKEFTQLGYINPIQAFYQCIHLSQLYHLIETSFCSDLMKTALKVLITKRFKELEDELSCQTG